MPIYVNLDMMLVKRKMALTELSARVGITLANLSILKTNKARAVRFSTLEALCRELDCQPGDLLEFGDDTRDNGEQAKDHGKDNTKPADDDTGAPMTGGGS